MMLVISITRWPYAAAIDDSVHRTDKTMTSGADRPSDRGTAAEDVASKRQTGEESQDDPVAHHHNAAFAVVLLVALSAWLLGNDSAVTPASAATETPPAGRAREGILVSATGEVLGVPDTLRADFAVGTTAATVDEALNLANAAMTQMQDALVDGGVAKADLQTSNASIQPTYGKQGKVTGYAVNEGLTAKIRTTSESGVLITAAIAAGGDAAQLSGVSFEIEQDDALLGAARRNAFADAEAKAELYAEQAGRTLGEVMSVTEDVPSNQIEAFAQSRAEAIPVPLQFPLQSGREQLAVTVTVEWSFR